MKKNPEDSKKISQDPAKGVITGDNNGEAVGVEIIDQENEITGVQPMRTATITVNFKNFSHHFTTHWTVKDVNDNESIALDATMEPQEEVLVSLKAPNGMYGEVLYKASETTTWTRKSLLEDGDTVEMY